VVHQRQLEKKGIAYEALDNGFLSWAGTEVRPTPRHGIAPGVEPCFKAMFTGNGAS
jgi:hypothetical protein